MKKRLMVALMLVAVLAFSTVNAPAGESCGCGADFNKRAAMDVCRVVRQVFGHAAYRFCIAQVKTCEKG